LVEAKPIDPQRAVYELSPRLPDGAMITSDSSSCAKWYARDLKIREGIFVDREENVASAWELAIASDVPW